MTAQEKKKSPSCPASANRGRSMNTFQAAGRSLSHRPTPPPRLPPFLPPTPRFVSASARCALFKKKKGKKKKGEATGRRWGVLNALISVTVWATSSLMWNRHLESVAHAVKKGRRADGETASSRDLQIAELHLSPQPFVLSRGSLDDFYARTFCCFNKLRTFF